MADKFTLSLGQRLRSARRQRGWSLGEIETHTSGEFKASVVGAYERGERQISVQRFVRIAALYNMAPGDLLPLAPPKGSVIDVEALAATSSDDLVERYRAAIQLLRKEPGGAEIRLSDQAILSYLQQAVETSRAD